MITRWVNQRAFITMGNKQRFKVNYLFIIASAYLFFFNGNAHSQVSITLGAQELYDDNIFLENDNRRPAPFVLNDNLLDDLRDGFISTVPSDSRDGRPNDDIISNIFMDFSGKPKNVSKYYDTSYQLKTGFLIFGTFTEQNRLTLDGNLILSLSDRFIPKPYYATLTNALVSASNNIAAAGGTATQTSQNYVITGETGIRDVKIVDKVTFDLGYTGSYQKYLGELLLSSKDDNDTETALNGVDFYSHKLGSAIKDQVTRDLELGVAASGGVQIFTDIENGKGETIAQDPKELDRNNAELLGTSKYTITKKLSFDGSAGVGFSQLRTDPKPFTVETIGENGQTQSATVTPKDSNTGLTYNLALNYIYRPGSLLTLGSNRGFSTNIDGQRFTSNTYFANVIEPLTDALQLTLGTRYVQFEDQSLSSLGETNRFEGSISMNYNISQSTSFNIGYNYSKQDGKSSVLTDTLGYSEPDYVVNRFFIGVNTGFVGLPL